MLIEGPVVKRLLESHGIPIHGVFHIGAYECEELPFYHSLGLPSEKVYWIDALPNKVEENTKKGIPNVFQSVISDKDGEIVSFNITNNGQSSSILEMGSHLHHHPHVWNISSVPMVTTTIDSFVAKHKIPMETLDFWNFDIQGVELKALKGATLALQHAKALYLEVNTEEVYKGCGLLHELDEFLTPHGFRRIETKMTGAGWGDALYLKTAV